jgi:hypothetical protein
MKLKANFGYMKMDEINPSAISIDGGVNITVSPRSSSLEFGKLNASRPFNLTKACLTCLWEFATWGNFAQKKNTNEKLFLEIVS